MNYKYWNHFLFLLFVAISAAIIAGGDVYKSHLSDDYLEKNQNNIALAATKKIETLIDEKKNATLALALALSANDRLQKALQEGGEIQTVLKDFSTQLSHETEFKNVWIQLIDRHGVNVSRSWTEKKGDNLAAIRPDVELMCRDPKILSSISVGQFDMTFKGMVPIRDRQNQFLGYIEVLTHFNSIAEKLQNDGFKPLILVDKRFKKQLKTPYSNLFAGDYYVANKNADLGLLKYVETKGVAYFIDPSNSHFIDLNSSHFIIRYTLYDIENRPIANILLFKDIRYLPFSLKMVEANINLYVLLAILGSAFLFFLLAKRNHDDLKVEQNNLKYTLISALFFVMASILYYFIVQNNLQKSKMEFIQSHSSNVEHDYLILYNSLSRLSFSIYKTVLDEPKVLGLMASAYEGEESKNKARQELWTLLQKQYTIIESFQLRQLHFHLRDNESFLRFHRPNKYGDNLTGIRNTVEWVNSRYTPINGFEEGRIFNGFRYVYPMTKGDLSREHLGSVELSFSSLAFIDEFIKYHRIKAGFLISEDTVDTRVFKEEQSNYIPTLFPGFYHEKEINARLSQNGNLCNLKRIDPALIPNIKQRIFEGKIFSIPSVDEADLFSFLPLKNPVTQKVVAVLIFEESTNVLENQNKNALFYLSIGFFSILLMTLLFYREITSRIKFQHLSLQAQSILDTQKSIIIITNDKIVQNANRSFLDFFGYPSLDKFLENNRCICECFLPNDYYFHLQKLAENESWIEVLLGLTQKDRVVLMQDKSGKEYSFQVDLNRFQEDSFVVTFSDISETVDENNLLFEKATHDQLTGLYNREFFESNIDIFVRQAKKMDKNVGIVLFDIDHFKHINDTFGHNRGDTVLYELSNLIQSSIRSDDYLFRWGGEEFIILIHTLSYEEMNHIIENLRLKVENFLFEEIEHLTCSFGFTLYHGNESIKELIARADSALYRAKDSGRNKVVGAV